MTILHSHLTTDIADASSSLIDFSNHLFPQHVPFDTDLASWPLYATADFARARSHLGTHKSVASG
jgi:hypothetical protein